MRDEYDIENLNPRKNPYSKRLKKQVKNPSAIDFKINSGWIFQKWSRRESNPCPKTNSLFFYYHSLFFFIPSALRKQTSSEFQ